MTLAEAPRMRWTRPCAVDAPQPVQAALADAIERWLRLGECNTCAGYQTGHCPACDDSQLT